MHTCPPLPQARLCVITDGSRGSSLALGPGSEGQAVMGDDVAPVQVPPYPGITQVDATGEGAQGGRGNQERGGGRQGRVGR